MGIAKSPAPLLALEDGREIPSLCGATPRFVDLNFVPGCADNG
jgi:hypothetical protein